MIKQAALLLVLYHFNSFTDVSYAAPTKSESTTKQEAPVRFYVANFPPYAYLEQKGPRGFFVDVIAAMARHANHPGTLDVVPWKRAQRELLDSKDQSAKLIFPLIRSPEREKQYRWVAELFVDDIVLFLKRGETRKIKSLADARGLKIGVVGGSALLVELEADGKHKVETAADIESCAKKLQVNRIDAWYVSRWVGVSTFKHEGIDPKLYTVSPAFHRMSIFLAASIDTSDAMVASWSKAFDIIKKNGEYDAILKKWKDATGDT